MSPRSACWTKGFRKRSRNLVLGYKPAMPSPLPIDTPRIPAIILAAGASTRLGQPKQLLRLAQWGQEMLLDRAVRLAQEAGAAPVLVVLGAYREEIQRTAQLLDCRVISNEEWREGMASSLRAGVRAVLEQRPPVSGVLVMVCDQLELSAEHLRRLLAAHRAAPDHAIASQYAGRSGVPVVIPGEMFPALLELTGDQGARVILQQASRIIRIEFPNGERDLDSPDDLLSATDVRLKS